MADKILMATMGLDIGGAETHIVELSKELKRRGYDVIIASNGGIYVDEIEKAGVRHVSIPLHNRKLGNMLRSYRLLKELIIKEKPDVVHAHARIPGFICGLIKKTVDFPFVTTAHWVFDASGLLKYLTNWGEKTIAVSDDIKDYLVNTYSTQLDNISVTINGIDTDKFSPVISGNKIIGELELNHRKPIIVHVSRLDEDRALAARRLIQIAPYLASHVDGVQIVIAGGGDKFEELHMKASAVNTQIGRKCIYMLGARSDISDIIAAGDLFIGVSRAALEAMSSGKMTILAGNEGYAGLFTPDKLERNILGNFCCRDYDQIDNDTFTKDIEAALSMPLEKVEKLQTFGREMIHRYYSVSKMAQDCIDVYETVIRPEQKIVMSGYYGFSNSGDEAILSTIIKSIHENYRRAGITVLSNAPEVTQKMYKCKAVERFKLTKVIKTIKNCDVLVSGGGSLFQDRTSTRSLLYYVFIVWLAERLGKKVMIYANGIGPVTKNYNRKLVAKVVERADVVTLRDNSSLEELHTMGVFRDDIHVTADPVFMIEPASEERVNEIYAENEIPTDKPIVMVSIRDWDSVTGFTKKIASFCDYIHDKYDCNIVLLAMQVPSDTIISRKVRDMMENESYIIEAKYEAQELVGIIGKAKFIMAMRLHAIIMAAKMNVPLIGIVYDPKVDYYLKLLGMHKAGSADSFDYLQASGVASAVLDDADTYRKQLREIEKKLTELSKENTRLLKELIDR